MPKDEKNTNTGTMNIQEYNTEKFELLEKIRELIEKIKEAIENLVKKIKEHGDKKEEQRAAKYAAVVERLKKAEDEIDNIKNASDINLASLTQIQTVLAGMNEKIRKLSPDDLENQMKELQETTEQLLNEAEKMVGQKFVLKGTINELVMERLNQKAIEGVNLDSLKLIRTIDDKLYIGIPSEKNGKITQCFEVTFSEEEGESNQIILGELQKMPRVSYEILNNSGESLDKQIVDVVNNKYSPEERTQMLLSETRSDIENMKQLSMFMEKHKDVQTNGKTSVKYDAKENEFQLYDERSQILLTLKKEKDRMVITSYETDESFIKKGTGTVIREYENKDGMISIKTNKAAIDKTIMKLLAHPATSEFLAYFDIDNQNINNRFEKAKELNEKFMRVNNLDDGQTATQEKRTQDFEAIIREIASRKSVKVDTCCKAGGVVADFPDNDCRVIVEFSKRGIPSIATVLQGEHKTDFVVNSPNYRSGSELGRQEEKVLEDMMILIDEAAKTNRERGNPAFSNEAANHEAKRQGKKGNAYSYESKAKQLLKEAESNHIDISNLEIVAIDSDTVQIRDKSTDSAMTLRLDKNGKVNKIEFNHLTSPNPENAIIDDTQYKIHHSADEFERLEEDGHIIPKSKTFGYMLQMAACIEFSFNQIFEKNNSDCLFMTQGGEDNPAKSVSKTFCYAAKEHARESGIELKYIMKQSISENINKELQEKFPDCNVSYQNGESDTSFTIKKLNGELTINVDLIKNNLVLCIYNDKVRKCTCDIPIENQQPNIQKAVITQYESTEKSPDELRKEIIADKSIVSMIDRATASVLPKENVKTFNQIDFTNSDTIKNKKLSKEM